MDSIEAASSPNFNGYYHHRVLQQETEMFNNVIVAHSPQHEQVPVQYYGDLPAPQESVDFDLTPAPFNVDAAIFAQLSQFEQNPYAPYQQLDFNLDMGTLKQNSYTPQEPTEQQFNCDFGQGMFEQNPFAPQEPSCQEFHLDLDLDQGTVEQELFSPQEPIYQQLDFNLDQGMDLMALTVEQQQLQQGISDMMANTQYLYNGYIYQ